MNWRYARLLLGFLVVGMPPAFAPPWTIAVASIGAVAVVLAVRAAHRRPAAVSAAIGAAVVTCAFSHAGTLPLAAEGILILGYVLASDTVFSPRQLVAGVVATLCVAAALAVHPAASAWLTGLGLVAIVAAFVVAVPGTRRR